MSVSPLPPPARERRATERSLRPIIERMPDGILIVNRDGIVRFANPAAESLFGRRAPELVGQLLGFPLAPGETAEVEIVRRGSEAIAELRVVDMEWEGEPAWLVSLRDVTDRKQAEERAQQLAREREARTEAEVAARQARFLSEASALLGSSLEYRSTLDNLAHLAVPRLADWCAIDVAEGTDGLRRIAYAHSAPEKEALLEELRERFPPDWSAPSPAAQALRTSQPVLYAEVTDELLQSITRDEEHASLIRELGTRSVIAVPLIARAETLGAATFACGQRSYTEADLALAHDFAQRAALSISNARLYEEAQQASKAKSEFLAVMSHELRTPLNAILGYTDLMDNGISGPVSERQREQLGRIRASSRHLLQLVEEILSFSRLEAGREEVHPTQTDVGTLLREVAAMVEPLTASKGLRFEVREPQEPVLLETDAGKVRQILLNLLSNAVKFTDAGTVSLEGERAGRHCLLRVRDTGIGIPEEHLGRIFEPFWQVQQSARRQVGGTGLGLSVADRLARLLGGRIEVESTPGTGSVFTLRLPVGNGAGS